MSGRGAAAGISDGAVRARTGRTWSEWFRVLDAVGARAMDHKAIVAYLSQRRGGGGDGHKGPPHYPRSALTYEHLFV